MNRLGHRLRSAGLALMAVAASAWADEGGQRVPVLPAYKAECSACHVAYPARGFPAASWQRVMSQLPHHFGTDASLDPQTTAQIATWLQANASRRRADTPPEDRMTRSSWFVREHREVRSAVWQRAAVGKPSNCAACHTGAAQGRFSEDDVRMPR
jgi:mono/diheme cytochrome c family protein